MSERMQSTSHETNDTPSRTEVLDSFAEKRTELTSQMTELTNKPGFKMNGEEKIFHNRDLKKSQQALDTFNEEYQHLGGDELDAAEEAVNALNFKSTAEDHIYAKARLRDAKDAFYANYLQSIEEDDLASTGESGLGSQAATNTEQPAETSSTQGQELIPHNADGSEQSIVKMNTDPASVEMVDDTSEEDGDTFTVSVVAKDGKISVSRPDGKEIPKDITIVTQPSAEKSPESSDDGAKDKESSANTSAAPTTPELSAEEKAAAAKAEEHPLQRKLGKAVFNMRQFAKNPSAFLASRLSTFAYMRKQEREAKDTDPQDEERARKRRLVRGIGAVAVVAGAGGIAYFAGTHGFHIGSGGHSGAADIVPAVPIPSAPAGTGAEHAADAATSLHVEAPSPIEVNANNGWYDVFQDMGIKSTNWHDTLQEVGPRLQKEGLAYWDQGHSEWRISPDHSFKLSTDLVDYIKNAAR